jgi:hypothetical protein
MKNIDINSEEFTLQVKILNLVFTLVVYFLLVYYSTEIVNLIIFTYDYFGGVDTTTGKGIMALILISPFIMIVGLIFAIGVITIFSVFINLLSYITTLSIKFFQEIFKTGEK